MEPRGGIKSRTITYQSMCLPLKLMTVFYSKRLSQKQAHTKFYRQCVKIFIIIEIILQMSYISLWRGWPQSEPFVEHFNRLVIYAEHLRMDRSLDDGHMEAVDQNFVPLLNSRLLMARLLLSIRIH